jgi:hypothetical protein
MPNTIKTSYNSGGAAQNPIGDSTDHPSLATVLRGIADDLDYMIDYGVMEGMMLDTPTTGSSQASGVGNTDWNVKIEKGIVVVDGVVEEFAEQDDFDIHSGSFLTGFSNGNSCIAAIIAKNVSGTVSCAAVTGTPDTTGSQVAPTDAEIAAALGATDTWTKIGECTLNRTADTTVTESDDNTKRHGAVGQNGWTRSLVKG